VIRWVLAASVFGAASACFHDDCPQPMPRAIEDAGLGEPCGATGNCAPGLDCRTVYAVEGYSSPSFTGNACSVPCDAGCPSGAACATLTRSVDTCVPSCAGDGDCSAGLSAGTCDGGHCERLQCKEDVDCPGGFTCEIPAIVCCPAGAHCEFTGKVPGYCRRS
jgi:hypothetical protein